MNDYPLLPGVRRARGADVVIRDADGTVLVAAEYRYEPAHRLSEVLPGKLPVVVWGVEGVATRIREFVEQRVAPHRLRGVRRRKTVLPPSASARWKHMA